MESDLHSIVEFFHLAERLKQEKRKGWMQRGVENAESVADHSFRLALLALVLGERQGLDACKCVKMALVHDLCEAIVGDVATNLGDEEDEKLQGAKHARESAAMGEITAKLGGKIGKQMMELWEEFEARASKEARLVYELDRLEAVFQAQEYASRQELRARRQVFFDYGNSKLRNPELRRVFGLLLEEMQKAK